MAGSDYYFHTFVRPHFQNLAKSIKFEVKIIITTGETVCLAKGINDKCPFLDIVAQGKAKGFALKYMYVFLKRNTLR